MQVLLKKFEYILSKSESCYFFYPSNLLPLSICGLKLFWKKKLCTLMNSDCMLLQEVSNFCDKRGSLIFSRFRFHDVMNKEKRASREHDLKRPRPI